jgi:hypothetical protein
VSECQVARSWVDVGSFHTRLVMRFMIFTASVRNILDKPSYMRPLAASVLPSTRNSASKDYQVGPYSLHVTEIINGVYGVRLESS